MFPKLLLFWFISYFIQLFIRRFPNTNGTYLYNARRVLPSVYSTHNVHPMFSLTDPILFCSRP